MLWSFLLPILRFHFFMTLFNAVAYLEGSQKLKRGALRGTVRFEGFPLVELAAGCF